LSEIPDPGSLRIPEKCDAEVGRFLDIWKQGCAGNSPIFRDLVGLFASESGDNETINDSISLFFKNNPPGDGVTYR